MCDSLQAEDEHDIGGQDKRAVHTKHAKNGRAVTVATTEEKNRHPLHLCSLEIAGASWADNREPQSFPLPDNGLQRWAFCIHTQRHLRPHVGPSPQNRYVRALPSCCDLCTPSLSAGLVCRKCVRTDYTGRDAQ